MRRSFLPALALLGVGLLCAGMAQAQVAPTAKSIVMEAPDVFGFKEAAMAPLPPLLEMLDATLKTDDKTGALTITRQDKAFTCTIDHTAAQANGKAVTLGLAPFKSGNLCFVPLAPLTQALGGACVVDTAKNTAVLTLPGAKPLTLPYMKMETTDEQQQMKPMTVKEYRDSEDQLFVMNADGSDVRRLTYNVYGTRLPSFSSDGSKWAYLRAPIIFPLGSVYIRSATNPLSTCVCAADMVGGSSICQDTVISPDGKTVYYSQAQETANGEGTCDVYCKPFAGGAMRKLAMGISPTLSPDGHTIAFSGIDMAKKETLITLMDTDGQKKRVIGEGDVASFSPDGQQLLFYRSYQKGEDPPQFVVTCKLAAEAKDIAVVEPGVKERTTDERNATFTPDSQHIICARKGQGVWIMKTDRTDAKQLTKEDDSYPVCMPDGATMLFIRKGHLFRMKSDGSEVTPLVPTLDVHEAKPSPDGKLIYFLVQPQALLGDLGE